MKRSFYVKDNILYLIENKQEIQLDISSQDDALEKVCFYGDLSCVKFLVSLKANINSNNNQPLIEAIIGCQEDYSIIKFLLENKADIAARDNEPLITACEFQNCDLPLIKLLVENKADVTARGNKVIDIIQDMYNRFFWYEQPSKEELKNRAEVLEYLIEKGADMDYISRPAKKYLLQNKYYKRWRKAVFKSFFRKVVTPLYYSPGFPGGEKVKNMLREDLNLI